MTIFGLNLDSQLVTIILMLLGTLISSLISILAIIVSVRMAKGRIKPDAPREPPEELRNVKSLRKLMLLFGIVLLIYLVILFTLIFAFDYSNSQNIRLLLASFVVYLIGQGAFTYMLVRAESTIAEYRSTFFAVRLSTEVVEITKSLAEALDHLIKMLNPKDATRPKK